MRIGIDIGGVIIGGAGSDTSFFTDDFLSTPEVDGAFDTVKRLAADHEIFFISKAGKTTAEKTVEWLQSRDFFTQVGVPENRLIFCRQRPEKVGIARELKIDLMIDDRLDVCVMMEEFSIDAILFTDWQRALELIDA